MGIGILVIKIMKEICVELIGAVIVTNKWVKIADIVILVIVTLLEIYVEFIGVMIVENKYLKIVVIIIMDIKILLKKKEIVIFRFFIGVMIVKRL